jgi:diguanylate cyclase (GGDEF)-like protein
LGYIYKSHIYVSADSTQGFHRQLNFSKDTFEIHMFLTSFSSETNGYSTAQIDRLPVALLFFDPQNRLLMANQAAANLLNRPREELIGQPVEQLFVGMADLLKESPINKEFNVDFQWAGSRFRAYLAPLRDNSTEGSRMVMLWQKNESGPGILQPEINPTRGIPIPMLLEAILESIRHGVLVVDMEGLPIYYNPSMRVLWDVPASTFEECGLGWPVMLSRRLKNPERLLRLAQAVREQPMAEMYDFMEMYDTRVLECHSRLQYPVKGGLAVRVWSFEDITEQQRTERELHYLSTHDGLTGLYNRAYFELRLRQLYTYPAYPVSMVMVDVDGLKKVNDRLGHPAGDDLLCQAAEVLRKACRTDDVVARLGGDEFGILLLRSNTEVIENVCERILHLQTLQRIGHPDLQLSLSLGSATVRNNAELANLFSRADADMYHIRRRKRAVKPVPRRFIRKDRES